MPRIWNKERWCWEKVDEPFIPPQPKTLQCNYCERAFVTASSLYGHLSRSHRKEASDSEMNRVLNLKQQEYKDRFKF